MATLLDGLFRSHCYRSADSANREIVLSFATVGQLLVQPLSSCQQKVETMIRALITTLAIGFATMSHAATITVLPSQPDQIATIRFQGPIVIGDDSKLAQLIASNNIRRLVINSSGGDVTTAYAIARLVKQRQISILILQRNHCESACFFILAASPIKFAYSSSVIGVHRIYRTATLIDNPVETLRVITLLRSYGVPHSILAKLASTSYPNMAYCDHAEMVALGVQFKPESFFVIL